MDDDYDIDELREWLEANANLSGELTPEGEAWLAARYAEGEAATDLRRMNELVAAEDERADELLELAGEVLMDHAETKALLRRYRAMALTQPLRRAGR